MTADRGGASMDKIIEDFQGGTLQIVSNVPR